VMAGIATEDVPTKEPDEAVSAPDSASCRRVRELDGAPPNGDAINQQATSQTIPFPAMQRFINEWLEQMCRPHSAYILFEVDMTELRPAIRASRARTGSPLGMTAYLTACWVRAIAEHKLLHAYRKGRRELVLFEDVDVTIPVEREMQGQKIPVNVIVRAANHKSPAEIDQEIRTAKTGENPQSRAIRWVWLFFLVPAFLRRFIWKRLLANPYRQQRINGTTLVTNAGMFGSGTGWGLFPSPSTASLLVGSIARKPGVVDGKIAVREYLCLTVIVDHDIVDGAVAARFTQRLKELIEGATLLDEAGVWDAENRDRPSRTSVSPPPRTPSTHAQVEILSGPVAMT
jgi:pyruvate/2-oxoglutarate dehydrogenase complex dihydrolipoamide acyltransferase (E2) component